MEAVWHSRVEALQTHWSESPLNLSGPKRLQWDVCEEKSDPGPVHTSENAPRQANTSAELCSNSIRLYLCPKYPYLLGLHTPCTPQLASKINILRRMNIALHSILLKNKELFCIISIYGAVYQHLMLCKCFFGCPERSKNKAWKSNEKNEILSTSLQRKGWRQDLHCLCTVLQHFVLVKRTAHRLTEKEQRTETGKNSDPFNPPLPEIWDEHSVIPLLLLPWLIVWLHLIVNNCWQNLGKPCSGPPLPPQSPSHHIIEKSLGGCKPDEHTLSSSPISVY